MNNLQQLFQDYSALRGTFESLELGWQPEALVPVQLEHRSEQLDRSGLEAHLPSLRQARGWLLCTDAVLILPHAADTALPPLCGEGVLNDGQRFRLEHLGGEQWRLHLFRISPSEPEQAQYLAQTLTHVHDHRAPANLRYQRLWGLQDNVPAPVLAVFDGFEEERT